MKNYNQLSTKKLQALLEVAESDERTIIEAVLQKRAAKRVKAEGPSAEGPSAEGPSAEGPKVKAKASKRELSAEEWKRLHDACCENIGRVIIFEGGKEKCAREGYIKAVSFDKRGPKFLYQIGFADGSKDMYKRCDSDDIIDIGERVEEGQKLYDANVKRRNNATPEVKLQRAKDTLKKLKAEAEAIARKIEEQEILIAKLVG